MYAMKEDRTISPETFTHLVSSTLYEKRFGNFFVEPVVAGLKDDGTPWIASTDVIGCVSALSSSDLTVQASTLPRTLSSPAPRPKSCTAWPSRSGSRISGLTSCSRPSRRLCSACVARSAAALTSQAIDRDAFSHGGAVWIIEPHQVTKRILKARLD